MSAATSSAPLIALLPHCGFLSETSRMLAIARALDKHGARTLIASHGGPYEHLLGEAGATWRRVDPIMPATEHRAFLDGLLSIGRGDLPLYSEDFLRAAVRAEARLFEETRATMAVIGFNLTSYVSSRVAKIPLATSHGGSFVPPVLDRALCPIPVNPPRPEMARLPPFAQRWLANRVPRWLKGPVRDLNRAADELGVARLPSFMALMCGDLTMVTDVPEVLGVPRDELEGCRPWRRALWPTTTFRYTGPLFARLDLPIPTRVESFLRADGPCVYLAPTSVSAPFLRDLVGAVEAAGARVLVGATIHDARDLENERVMVEGVMPNHIVMGRVAACVIMGGQGSVQTAMSCGTPFVGMPYHAEQELNVALAERRGMAIRLSPADGRTARMTEAVNRLLHEPSFRANAQRVKGHYSGIDGADGCARAIMEYLTRSGRAVAGADGASPPARQHSWGRVRRRIRR
jgi:UDP:flavonoid glycosyltransferase YjiC (YdhE family)